MNTSQVEKVLGKKFQQGRSLKDQSTSEQWAEICFRTAVETDITAELSRVGRTENNRDTEARIQAKWQKVLDECKGDYNLALQFFS